jgi:hypothetical protein
MIRIFRSLPTFSRFSFCSKNIDKEYGSILDEINNQENLTRRNDYTEGKVN